MRHATQRVWDLPRTYCPLGREEGEGRFADRTEGGAKAFVSGQTLGAGEDKAPLTSRQHSGPQVLSISVCHTPTQLTRNHHFSLPACLSSAFPRLSVSTMSFLVPPASNTLLSHPHLIPQQICQLICKINPRGHSWSPTLPATGPPPIFIWGLRHLLTSSCTPLTFPFPLQEAAT